jgi:hypothetical protein
LGEVIVGEGAISLGFSRTGTESEVGRQAIVLVHGMGEQVPMDTVRDFADAVWGKDKTLHDTAADGADPGELFFVPDPNSGSRELRRVSTRKSRPRRDATGAYQVRNDFFELYWADSTTDTTWRDFLLWYARLVFRSPRDVPPPVLFIWCLLWLMNIVFVLAAEIIAIWLLPVGILDSGTIKPTVWILAGSLAVAGAGYVLRWLAPRKQWIGSWMIGGGGFLALWCIVVLLGLPLQQLIRAIADHHNVFWPGFVVLASTVLLLIQGFLIRFFGDVGRYTLASPGNITARQKVRDRGLDLLKQLSSSGRYDRIILVAHSLGTMIAYDLVCLLWADYVSSLNKNPALVPSAEGTPLAKAIGEVTTAAAAQPFDLAVYRKAQRVLFHVLRDADKKRVDGKSFQPDAPILRWLISDLVTIACPLTHAEFLVARTAATLKGRFKRRELSRCPPLLQTQEDNGVFRRSLTYRKGHSQRFAHDGVFAVMRWTNIHDKPRHPMLFLQGDFIAGPVAPLFGLGIADIKATPTRAPGRLPPRFFSHTIYWSTSQAESIDPPASVKVIRDAVNILDESDAEAGVVAAARRN